MILGLFQRNYLNISKNLIHFRITSITPKISHLSSLAHSNNGISKTRIRRKIAFCESTCLATQPKINDKNLPKTTDKQLTIIFAWTSAKDKYLDKYIHLWFSRGFDVLTVRPTQIDNLFPPIGSQLIASNLVTTLTELSPRYNSLVIHAFSAGGYHFGEFIVEIKAQHKLYILEQIKGVVFDSIIHLEGLAKSTANTVTSIKIIQPIIEKLIGFYFDTFNKITWRNYKRAAKEVYEPHTKYKVQLFYSKDDPISFSNQNDKLVEKWMKGGNLIRFKCWNESRHVCHLHCHREEYEQELDSFIKSLQLD